MRAFVAAEILEKIKDYLEKTEKNLSRTGLQATWVKRKKMHLTLLFFKNLNPNQITTSGQILKDRLKNQSPIKLKLGLLDAFPSLTFPKIVWVSLEGETEKLTRIANQLRQESAKQKISFDPKPFIPHLTLGRLRPMRPRQRKRVAQTLARFQIKKKPKFEIKQIALIKSKPTAKGSVYTYLEKVSLNS